MIIANLLAGLALLYSIWNNIVEHRNKKRLESTQLQIQKSEQQSERREREFNQAIARLNSSETIRPHLYLNLNDADIKNRNGKMIFGVRIRNVGLASAVNIQMGYENLDNELSGMFRSETNDPSLSLYEYLSATTALSGEEIFFALCVRQADEILDFFDFKLRFSDLAGRIYEQEFRFGYGSKFQSGYNLNRSTSRPKLIQDIV